MNSELISVVIIGAATAGFVQGLSGFAFAMVSMAFWAWTLEPKLAAILAVFCSLLGQLLMLPSAKPGFDVRRIAPFVIGGAAGVPIGAALLPMIDQTAFRILLGTFLVLWSATTLLLGQHIRLSLDNRALDGSVGVVGGMLGGLGGLAGPIPTLWCSFRPWTKDTQRAAREMDIETTAEENARFGASVPNWPAFDDSPTALQYLKKHYKLVILSNVDRRSFAGSDRRLQVEFDYIFTAQDIGSYKPSLRNFDYLIEKLAASGIHKHEILHTAESLFHDHLPANKVGLASAWIYRRHDQQGFGATRPPDTMPHYDFKFTSMADMVRAHQDLMNRRTG